MKATELRIGNLITSEENLTFEVKGIGSEGVNKNGCCNVILFGKPDINIFIDNDFSKLKGIELSEEWLTKFGFEKVFYIKDMQCKIENDILICGYVDSEYGMDEVTNIQFVHQLQNLYFALTGTELELK